MLRCQHVDMPHPQHVYRGRKISVKFLVLWVCSYKWYPVSLISAERRWLIWWILIYLPVYCMSNMFCLVINWMIIDIFQKLELFPNSHCVHRYNIFDHGEIHGIHILRPHDVWYWYIDKVCCISDIQMVTYLLCKGILPSQQSLDFRSCKGELHAKDSFIFVETLWHQVTFVKLTSNGLTKKNICILYSEPSSMNADILNLFEEYTRTGWLAGYKANHH